MHAADAYPVYASGHCCFVTGAYELGPGEHHVLVLDLDNEDIPDGMLCLSEEAVRRMAHELDLPIVDNLDELHVELAALRAENQRMRRAFTQVVHAAKLAGVTAYTDELEVA